ncbi:MAG: dTDP-4-dehydrorhamnose 3,5-epimerase family protein [Gemmatimonadota bacterium]|nr:dTDP-4-dehydrorhamnose 3,5-epimerase family protein [Gemmatimonadota bacterium]
MSIRLMPTVEQSVTFQSYGSGSEVEGVFQHPLRKHVALEGWFMEHLRLAAGEVQGLPFPFTVRQISISRAVPGRVNGFHIHPKRGQDELWCVVDGTLLVWLIDVREGSPTAGNRRKVVLHAEAPSLLHIPTGVAHGYKAGPTGALLVYAMNSQFDVQDPNEGRLPWDFFGAELWEDDRG